MKVINFAETNSVLNQYVAEIRDVAVQGDRMRFRRNIERIGEIMAYEMSKELTYSVKQVQTPLGVASVSTPDDEVVIATVFRAGLPLHTGFLNMFDHAGNAFVSAYRYYKDKECRTVDVHIEYIATPDLSKKTEDEAKAALKELRLGVNVQTGTSDDVPEGQVYDQSPAAGTKVDVHTQVTINISSGKEKFSLDDVTGMQYQQAQAQLENDGLVVSLEFDYSDSVGSDKVISTSPKAGSQVAKGDTITITASKGKETKTTTVPNLLGQNIDDAIQMIKDAGLTYNGKSSDYSDSYSENQVMNQSISAGKTVDEGTTISLTVSLGSRVTSYSASIPIESPFGRDITDGDGNTDVYDSGQVTVVVYKPDGSSETVYDQNTSEGSLPGSVSTTSTASGSGTVYVYLNGVQVSSYSVDFE